MKAFNKMSLYWILTIILVIAIMTYGTYLTRRGYIVECFSSIDTGSPETSHNVDQPINTKTSCKNMCGPLARCSITGEQCTSDVDCYGCLPKVVTNTGKIPNYGANVAGLNDAGKLTGGVEPTYSTLTTDIGTRAAELQGDTAPPHYFQGVNVWKGHFDDGYKLFNQRYKPPPNLTNEPNYIQRFTMSGEFTEDGPLPSNSD